VRLDDLEDEKVVLVDEGVVVPAALEKGVALGDQRRRDAPGGQRRQAEMCELVDVGAGRVADANHDIGQLRRWQADDAFVAAAASRGCGSRWRSRSRPGTA